VPRRAAGHQPWRRMMDESRRKGRRTGGEPETGDQRRVEVSIFRAGPGSSRAEKILPMTIPLDAPGLNFRAVPGLGRAARTFYSVKQLKIAFRAGLGPIFFFCGLQDLCPRPPSMFRGRVGPGPGSKCLGIEEREGTRARRGEVGGWQRRRGGRRQVREEMS
jgi:hypothetical protein